MITDVWLSFHIFQLKNYNCSPADSLFHSRIRLWPCSEIPPAATETTYKEWMTLCWKMCLKVIKMPGPSQLMLWGPFLSPKVFLIRNEIEEMISGDKDNGLFSMLSYLILSCKSITRPLTLEELIPSEFKQTAQTRSIGLVARARICTQGHLLVKIVFSVLPHWLTKISGDLLLRIHPWNITLLFCLTMSVDEELEISFLSL